jgi:hypothetical protein
VHNRVNPIAESPHSFQVRDVSLDKTMPAEVRRRDDVGEDELIAVGEMLYKKTPDPAGRTSDKDFGLRDHSEFLCNE